MSIEKVHNTQRDMQRRAAAVRAFCTGDENGMMLESATGTAKNVIAIAWGAAISAYEKKNGRQPPADLLASAHAAVERLMNKASHREAPATLRPLLESAAGTMTSSTGIDTLSHYAALYLPALLAQQTADLATWIDCSGGFGKNEIVALDIVAGADFGDVKKGDSLSAPSPNLFGSLARITPFDTQPNGTAKKFVLTTAAGVPIKPGTVRINADHIAVSGFDDAFAGADKGNVINCTGVLTGAKVAIDHVAGTITLDCTGMATPPAAKLNIEAEYCVDDEILLRDTKQLPALVYEMSKKISILKPQILTAEFSVMAEFDAQRELGFDLSSSSTQAMISLIAAEADLSRVKRLAYLCTESDTLTIDFNNIDGVKFHTALKRGLLAQSNKLSDQNGYVGTTHIVAGADAATWLMSHSEFNVDPEYLAGPGIRLAGILFGSLPVYIVSESFSTAFAALKDMFPLSKTDLLLVANDGAGHSPVVAGDALPPIPGMPIVHDVTPSLMKQCTLLAQTLCDSNIDGHKYCRRVKLDIAE